MSMQSISVSVIIPVFNNAATISRALDSVFNQTAQPREIFIVDDASTDNSCAVIEKYIQDKTNARLLRTATNCGPSAARNIGWAATTRGQETKYLSCVVLDGMCCLCCAGPGLPGFLGLIRTL